MVKHLTSANLSLAKDKNVTCCLAGRCSKGQKRSNSLAWGFFLAKQARAIFAFNVTLVGAKDAGPNCTQIPDMLSEHLSPGAGL